MQLRELQKSFQSHLLGGENTVLPQILDAPPLSPAARLEIYRAAYVNRLIDALRATYVKIHQVLGDELFASMASEFIASNASGTRSIRWYGAQLAGFLARTMPYSGQPVLAELARFEWALAAVFDAADAVSLTRTDIAQVDPSKWGGMRFKFHKSMRNLSFDWNAIAVWQAIDAGVEAPAPAKAEQSVTWLLWRQDFKNFFRSLEPVELTALAWAVDGASFSLICEELRRWLPDEEIPLRAAGLVAAWADSGILIEPLELENMG